MNGTSVWNGWVVGVAVALLLCALGAQAQAAMDMVPVGNAGNDPDDTGYGAVPYEYQIGKYEVTNSQYSTFLNALLPDIAAPESGDLLPGDTYGLYRRDMETSSDGGILYEPGAASGGKFSTKADMESKPVNFVSWYDAVRFANWLQNGQGAGDTESGTYAIAGGGQNSGTVTVPDHAGLAANWALPNEDEWYKAAYHQNDGVTANYWEYPTQSDTAPTAEVPPGTDPNGSANIDDALGTVTDIGAYVFKPSESAYSTYDQGGNVMEWTDTLINISDHVQRGGGFLNNLEVLGAADRNAGSSSLEYAHIGFRVAMVPEPATLALAALGAAGLLLRMR